MRRLLSYSLAAAAFTVGALTLTACGASSGSSDGPATVDVGPGTVILDVRTAAEYSGGHLDGAQLLNLNGGEVAAAIPGLDPEAEYLVYCRSGNRSGQALALMEQAGFTSVTNLGSLEQAAKATGVPVVTD